MVGLRLTPPLCAAAAGECDERVGGGLLPVEDRAGLLVGRALGLGDAPDRVLEGDALLERQAPAEHELAPPRVQVMLSARCSYSAWSSSTAGGTSVRAASAIALGALPTATRAISASLAGVANWAAAATWSSVNAPALIA